MKMKTSIAALLLAFSFEVQKAWAKAEVYAFVAIWDVAPDQAQSFERSLLQKSQAMVNEKGFVNERILRNVDELVYHYATYTKSTDRMALEIQMKQRIAGLRQYCRRDPETHVAQVTFTYYSNQGTDRPNGREFGQGKLGQIAHLGLFIPYPEFRAEYDRTLHHVKIFTRDRRPKGYFGEDVLVEADLVDPEAQTPYSPQALEPSRMSINYGEYATMEDAENSYIKRGADRPRNPAILGWERIFYSSLQVPTRFYIFKVIGNVDGGAQRASRGRSDDRAGS